MCCPEGNTDCVLQGPEDLQEQAGWHVQGWAPSGPHQRRGHCRHGLHQEETRVQAEVSCCDHSGLNNYSFAFINARNNVRNRGAPGRVLHCYSPFANICLNADFCYRLENGGDYLFQASDDEQMSLWVDSINRQSAGQEEAGARAGKSQTLPPGSDKRDEPKKPRSFFTLKKK